MANRSKTTEKLRGGVTGKGFVPGDPRINRKGRPRIPKDQAELNALLDEIFAEMITDDKGNSMQKLRVALNRLLLNKNPAGIIHVLDRRFGKVTERVDVNNTGEITIKVIRKE